MADEASTLGMRAACYLAKPSDPDLLVDEVRRILVRNTESALVVEDDRDTSKLLVDSFKEHEVHVRTAGSGREGEARLGEFTPSVIILDLVMALMDGFEFLEHMQANPVWREILVVILSAKMLKPDEIRKLSKITKCILTKGRGDAGRVIEAALGSVVPRRRLSREVRS